MPYSEKNMRRLACGKRANVKQLRAEYNELHALKIKDGSARSLCLRTAYNRISAAGATWDDCLAVVKPHKSRKRRKTWDLSDNPLISMPRPIEL